MPHHFPLLHNFWLLNHSARPRTVANDAGNATSKAGRLGVVAPDNENFVIRVVCFGRQTFNTSLERLVTVRIRNDNGNCCRFRQFAPYAKRVSAPVDGNMRRFATTLQMILNGTPRGIELVPASAGH